MTSTNSPVTRQTWQALGGSSVLDNPKRAGTQHARSIYAIQDIAPGELLTTGNIRVIRPGFGLAPKHFQHVLGTRAKQAIERGTALNWSLLALSDQQDQ